MIRFRFQEDERRFIKLHSEMFEKIARAGLAEAVGSETLRNVGKIEQMAFMEGIRQGLAIAAIAHEMVEAQAKAIPEPYAQKAFQLHALIYGSSDTPLRIVEKEWLGKLNLDADHFGKSWLDDKPMRFAPATLQELLGETPPVAPMMTVRSATKPVPVRRMPPPEAMHGAEVTVPEPWQKGEYEPDDEPVFLRATTATTHFGEDGPDGDDDGVEPPGIKPPGYRPLSMAQPDGQADDPDAEVPAESPEFLDIARDAILLMKRGGWDPKTWQDLILGLHRQMSVDAGYLDIQLTTHVGRTVLDQCGLAGIAPPDMMNFAFLDELPPNQNSVRQDNDDDDGRDIDGLL